MRRSALAILALSGCFMDNPAWLGLTDGASGGGSSDSGSTGPVVPGCEPLPAPPAGAVVVEPGDASVIAAAIARAGEGGTVLLADGTYALEAASLVIDVRGVALRSQSGDAASVVLDGGASMSPLVVVRAPDVQIGEVTFRGGLTNAVRVDPSGPAGASGVSIDGVAFVDGGSRTFEAVAAPDGAAYADEGLVQCSTFRRSALLSDPTRCMTDTALVVRGGRGWVVRDNVFERYGCFNAYAATLAMSDGARDSLVVYNRFIDCTRAVLVGNQIQGGERVWADAECMGTAPWGHIGGLVANNVAWVGDPQIDPDSMFSVWSGCDARIYHNTAAVVGDGFYGVEYRFENTDARIFNNLTTDPIGPRDGGLAQVQGNIDTADPNDFVDFLGGDVHLRPSAAAIGQGLRGLDVDVGPDIDGEARDGEPDVGADEWVAR